MSRRSFDAGPPRLRRPAAHAVLEGFVQGGTAVHFERAPAAGASRPRPAQPEPRGSAVAAPLAFHTGERADGAAPRSAQHRRLDRLNWYSGADAICGHASGCPPSCATIRRNRRRGQLPISTRRRVVAYGMTAIPYELPRGAAASDQPAAGAAHRRARSPAPCKNGPRLSGRNRAACSSGSVISTHPVRTRIYAGGSAGALSLLQTAVSTAARQTSMAALTAGRSVRHLQRPTSAAWLHLRRHLQPRPLRQLIEAVTLLGLEETMADASSTISVMLDSCSCTPIRRHGAETPTVVTPIERGPRWSFTSASSPRDLPDCECPWAVET